ncbi:MAG: protein kinase [Candidatus Eiseniibacteriota bacterium]|jgi:serine/threonine protein kinase
MPRSFRGFEITNEPIGRGGMALIYKGVQTALDRPVAVKVLHPALSADQQYIWRFEGEAKSAAALRHPNIVTILDFGSQDDTYFIVMEYVDGTDLRRTLDRTRPLPPEIVLALLEEICLGLEVAHTHGTVHRDIKPGNILISKRGEVKIADFGLARDKAVRARLSTQDATLPGTILGTLAYMSPEQLAGEEVNAPSDIFSLGVMAYELLTGVRPFSGQSDSEVRESVLRADPPPIMERCPTAIPEIESLVRRMIAKQPEDRFASVTDVLREIRNCMDRLDPSGAFMKHRRDYLRRFVADPAAFTEMLRAQRAERASSTGPSPHGRGTPASPATDPSAVTVAHPADEAPTELAPPVAATHDAPSAPGTRPRSGPHDAPPSGPTDVVTRRSGAARAGQRPLRSRPVFWVAATLVLAAVVVTALWMLGGDGGPPATVFALDLDSTPAGAEVAIRSPGTATWRRTGQRTPCRLEALEAGGPLEVRLARDGHVDTTLVVDPVAGGEVTLRTALRPLPRTGRLTLRTTPPGARVSIVPPGAANARDLGRTPLTAMALAAGHHTLTITPDDERFRDTTLVATIARDEPLVLDVTLARRPATSDGEGSGSPEKRDPSASPPSPPRRPPTRPDPRLATIQELESRLRTARAAAERAQADELVPGLFQDATRRIDEAEGMRRDRRLDAALSTYQSALDDLEEAARVATAVREADLLLREAEYEQVLETLPAKTDDREGTPASPRVATLRERAAAALEIVDEARQLATDGRVAAALSRLEDLPDTDRATARFRRLVEEIQRQDRTAPEIEYTPVERVGEQAALRIRATVTDEVGVRRVELHVRKGRDGEFSVLPMEAVGDGVYEVEVPRELYRGAGMDYYITATDQNANQRSSSTTTLQVDYKLTPPPPP